MVLKHLVQDKQPQLQITNWQKSHWKPHWYKPTTQTGGSLKLPNTKKIISISYVYITSE
jgi:hypothetical protein